MLWVVPRDLATLWLVMLRVVVLTVPSCDECAEDPSQCWSCSEPRRVAGPCTEDSVWEESDQPSTYRSATVKGERLRTRKLFIHFLKGYAVARGCAGVVWCLSLSAVSPSYSQGFTSLSISSSSLYSMSMPQSSQSAGLVSGCKLWCHEESIQCGLKTIRPKQEAATGAAPEAELRLMVRQSRWTLNRKEREQGDLSLLKRSGENSQFSLSFFHSNSCPSTGDRSFGSRQLYIALRNRGFESHPCSS